MSIFKITSLLFLSLNSVLPLNYDHIYQSNNNIVIGDNGEHINIRQYNRQDVSSQDEVVANIETTNVDYDLRIIYGGEENYLTYNIWNLAPTSLDSKDTSFKFLCCKPCGKNLYLYFYHEHSMNSSFTSCDFKISTHYSAFTESYDNFITYNARFINSYGYKMRFFKVAIDNFFKEKDESEEKRIYISDIDIKFSTGNLKYSFINDEIIYQNETSDFIYEYFKDNYIRVVDGLVSLLLTACDTTYAPINDHIATNSDYMEDFYYFFTTDKKMDDLIQIQYDYYLLTYIDRRRTEYSHTFNMPGYTYKGLYENSNKNDFEQITPFYNNTIEKGEKIGSVTRPYFLWWTQNKEYKLQNIQNCLDLSNLDSDDNKGFKDFINSVQDKRLNDKKNKFDWCFRVTSLVRSMKAENVNTFTMNCDSVTTCHEVEQTIITWLKFRTNDKTFEFNVLDIPKDTEEVYLQVVPFQTLSDVLIEKATDFWNWFTSNLSTILHNMFPFLAIIGSILLVILFWPLIKALIRLISIPFNKFSEKRKNRKEIEKNEDDK